MCVAVEGTCVSVEQDDVAHESCVEDDQDQEQDGHISQPVIYIHPKTEITSYAAEQTEANWCFGDWSCVANFIACR